MTPADRARNNAISLEAKKDALSQRQSGDWKVSFTVQGVDMDARLTQAPMGTRYAVVLVEIGDDEQPVQKEARAKPRQSNPPSPHPDGAARPKMDWRDMQPAAQAGIRCGEPSFQTFLKEEYYPHWSKSDLDAAVCVRLICGVESRSELGTNQKARVLWHQLDSQFQAWKALEHA
jgi:hypothetical protein